MIEEEAYVAAVADGQIWIEKQRQTACSGCAQACPSASVSGFFASKPVRLKVLSDVAVLPGDRVVVGIAEEALASGSLWIYLLPLLGLFAGALLGKFLLGSDIASALGGLAGMGLCYAGLKASRLLERQGYQPVILRKLN
jgi:sigma-E factor negative regulatory protein RseC